MDKKGIKVGDEYITLRKFKRFVNNVIKDARKLLFNDLMFGGQHPAIEASQLQDDMANQEAGFSFLDMPKNGLSNGSAAMINLLRAAPKHRKLSKANGRWDRRKVKKYLNLKHMFLELLMILFHLTGGQPARGPEIGTIKFRNSHGSRRNFYIDDGEAFFYTEYHKARAATNFSYYVARYLPPAVSELALYYIAYIRPFCSLLYNQVIVSATQTIDDGNYLFCSEGTKYKAWKGDQLSSILRREMDARIQVKFGISLYRHFVIAVTRVHVKDIAPFFDKDDEGAEKIVAQRPARIYAWQGGHSHGTNAAHYGIDAAYPGRLQPELLEEYRRISTRWHDFLDGLTDELTADGDDEEDINDSVDGDTDDELENEIDVDEEEEDVNEGNGEPEEQESMDGPEAFNTNEEVIDPEPEDSEPWMRQEEERGLQWIAEQNALMNVESEINTMDSEPPLEFEDSEDLYGMPSTLSSPQWHSPEISMDILSLHEEATSSEMPDNIPSETTVPLQRPDQQPTPNTISFEPTTPIPTRKRKAEVDPSPTSIKLIKVRDRVNKLLEARKACRELKNSLDEALSELE